MHVPLYPRLTLSGFLAIISLAGGLCQAQTGGVRVGVINLKLIVSNMQETLDAQHQALDMQTRLTALINTHQTAMKDLQEKLAKMTHHDSVEYQQLLDELDQKSLSFGRDEREQQMTLARFQNHRFKQAFDEINATVTEQAKAKGLDLVVLDDSNPLPENHGGIATAESLERAFLIRTVAYKTDQVDFTSELIALLNKNYKSPAGAIAQPSLPTMSMQIGSKTYQLEIAADDASRERGLMERDALPADHGMIFVFDHASNQTFWMHHTRFPLNIVFTDEHGKVVSVHEMKPYDETPISSDGPAKYAIELPAGTAAATGVKAGDDLQIPPAADAALKK